MEIPTVKELQHILKEKYKKELCDRLRSSGEAESFLTGLLSNTVEELAEEFKEAGYTFSKGGCGKDYTRYYVMVGEPFKEWHGSPM